MGVVDMAEEAARSILAHAVDAFDQPGAVPAPARQYIAHNKPAWDCEQLAVYLARLWQKPTLQIRPGHCQFQHFATFAVEIVRCHVGLVDNNGKPTLPPAADLDRDGSALTTDGWVLWQYLVARRLDGSLIDGVSCGDVLFGEAIPEGPNGGFAGWTITFNVTLIPNPADAGS